MNNFFFNYSTFDLNSGSKKYHAKLTLFVLIVVRFVVITSAGNDVADGNGAATLRRL